MNNRVILIDIIVVLLIIFFVVDLYKEGKCEDIYHNDIVEHKYVTFKGCMVKQGSNWVYNSN